EESATFADVFEKIYRVVRTSTQLNHPNICIIYDLSEEKKIPYITMEFVEGSDLEAMLQKKHQFKRAELMNVLQQTCDALDFAHKKGVIHQDMKSTNILVTSDLHVKITDFGIAGLDEIAAAQTKKLLSIPFYISPEQALGEKVTTASDLFSLGVIMYQLLSGQLPFPGTSAANVIMMIARDNPSTPKDLDKSGIKKEDWESFFNIALAKTPSQRFRSAKEMLDAVTAIIPAAETSYFPYGFTGETTGKFEKTNVNDQPTMMIDSADVMSDLDQAATITASREDYEKAKAALSEQSESAPTVMVKKPELPPSYTPEPAAAGVSEGSAPTQLMQSPKMAPPPPSPPPSAPTQMMPPPSAPTQMMPPPSAPTQMMQAPSAPTQLMQPPSAPTQLIQAPQKNSPAGDGGATMVPTPKIPEPPRPTPPPPAAVGTTMPPKPQTVVPPPPPTPASQPPAPQAPAAPQAVFDPAAAAAAKQAQAPKAGGPPNMTRYLIGAVVVAFLILLIGGGIFFLRSRKSEPEKPPVVVQPVQPKPQPPKPQPPKPEPQKPPAVTTGQLTISSDPLGATVLVNDQQKGVTPLNLPDLPLGHYTVKLQLNGYDDSQQEVDITADAANKELPFTLSKTAAVVGSLQLDSKPEGATIIIGKRALGVTPKKLGNLKPSKYNITLKLNGYEDYTGSVKIKENETATLLAQLVEIPKPEPPKPVAKEEPPKEPEVKPGQLVALGPGVVPPKAVKKAFAKYPEVAKRNKLQGVVGMSVLVSETGNVLEVKVIQSANPILDDAAVAAVKEWTFEPATKSGVPVKVWIPVSMAFQSSR
ncbi:MAG: hypothetical protein C5B54_04010, partial [Acidobacteria bacterium]